VDEEKMMQVCGQFSLVVHLSPKVFQWHNRKKKTSKELANPGLPGKWPSKRRRWWKIKDFSECSSFGHVNEIFANEYRSDEGRFWSVGINDYCQRLLGAANSDRQVCQRNASEDRRPEPGAAREGSGPQVAAACRKPVVIVSAGGVGGRTVDSIRRRNQSRRFILVSRGRRRPRPDDERHPTTAEPIVK